MSDPTFFVATPRLLLSYLQPDSDAHCDFLVALYNSPEFIASIGGKPTAVTTREAARTRLAGRFRDEHARNGFGTYLVSLRADPAPVPSVESSSAQDGRPTPVYVASSTGAATPDADKARYVSELATATPIGTVGLMQGVAPDRYPAPDVGFAVLPAHMRKGYTREAVLGLLGWLEGERGVKEVFGFTAPGNEASIAVFRSVGFEDRGIVPLRVFGGERSAVWTKKGMSEDLSMYGL